MDDPQADSLVVVPDYIGPANEAAIGAAPESVRNDLRGKLAALAALDAEYGSPDTTRSLVLSTNWVEKRNAASVRFFFTDCCSLRVDSESLYVGRG